MERHEVQQTQEFAYLIFMKCVLNIFELGREKGGKTHTKKRYTAKYTSRKTHSCDLGSQIRRICFQYIS